MTLSIFLTIIFGALSGISEAELCTSSVCGYDFVIRHQRTMMTWIGRRAYHVTLNGTRLQASQVTSQFDPGDPNVGKEVKPEDVITADGFVRTIITVNHQFPGPTIEVMEGAEIVVKVTNELSQEGTSIHWHGLWVKETPWMDGVSHITQCSIQPDQSFTYRVRAQPAGTHWYHAHHGMQRIDGLYGLIIVHEKKPTLDWFPLIVSDWFHDMSTNIESRHTFKNGRSGTGEYTRPIPKRVYGHDRVQISALDYSSGLINGRGRFDPQEQLPLSVFNVNSSEAFILRVVNAASEFPYEISIDDHSLEIISAGGPQVEPVAGDSLIVNPGESFVVKIVANQTGSRYWVRSRSLGEGRGPNMDHLDGIETLAILSYSDDVNDPTSSRKNCTEENPCFIINCRFGFYAPATNKHCIHHLKTKNTSDLAHRYGLDTPDDEVIEIFLNLGFSVGSSVNSHRFRPPRIPLYQENHVSGLTPCDPEVCKDGCSCTYTISVPENKTVQLVLMNHWEDPSTYHILTMAHSFHLHGYSFAVLGMGFPDQNTTIAAALPTPNQDYQCETNQCRNPRWRSGMTPDLNLKNPSIRDTVNIPERGYTVIRFRTNNPGYWLFHCHQATHLMEGMAGILKVGDTDNIVLPSGFPRCSDFPTVKQAQEAGCVQNISKDEHLPMEALVGGAVGLFLAGVLLASVACSCYNRRVKTGSM